MSDSDHDYALVVMLNQSESTGEKLTFTLQKVNQSEIDSEQTRVAFIDNEGIQAKIALPASIMTNIQDGDKEANTYLQNVVLQSLESVAKSQSERLDFLEDSSSNSINIVLEGDTDCNNIIEANQLQCSEDISKDDEMNDMNESPVDNGNSPDDIVDSPGDTPNEICVFQDLTAIQAMFCLLYTSPSPRDGLLSRMPSSA